MASVWSAVHETLGRPVAVKFIHAQAKASDVITARFMREARIAASIQHRFVVDIFDFGETAAGEPYMVMEQLDGESLADRITRGPPIPVKTFVRMIEECLTGLDAVHSAGIIHRDLKPENIFVIHDGDGTFPKLLDFGISRVDDSLGTDRRTKLTREGAVIGTPWYMSPEQVRGRSDLDHRADLYAMAVILYEVLSGALPFDSDTLGDLMVKIATEEAPTLMTLRPDLPAELSDLVEKGMAKRPEERFQDATTFRLALRKIRQELPDDAFTIVMKPSPSEPPQKLGSADMIVRPRLPSEPAPPMASAAPTLAPADLPPASRSQGELSGADTIEAAPRSAAGRWIAAAVLLLAVAGAGAAYVMREGESPAETEELGAVETPETTPTSLGSAPIDEPAPEITETEPEDEPPETEPEGESSETSDEGEEPTGEDESAEMEAAEMEAAPTTMRRRRARRRWVPMMDTPEHFDDPGF